MAAEQERADYEESYQERKARRAKQALEELPPGLRELAAHAMEVADVVFGDEPAPLHRCRPPAVGTGEMYRKYHCSCGRDWEWNGIEGRWKLV